MTIATLRGWYRRHIRWPWLDTQIYRVLDAAITLYCSFRGYYFPTNYIRRWKLDMIGGLYESETTALFQRLIRPGMTVIDVGAHIGYFTRLFSHLVGTGGAVYAFEADPENFLLLRKNMRRFHNVICTERAVGDRDGAIHFYHCDEKAGCHSTLPNVPVNFPMKKITVQSCDLDTWLEQRNLHTINAIKMDIEGGEYAALQGLQRTIARNPSLDLILEFAPDWIQASGIEPGQFLRELAEQGFSLFAIMGNHLEPVDPCDRASYERLIPTTGRSDSYNKFFNLYCRKGAAWPHGDDRPASRS